MKLPQILGECEEWLQGAEMKATEDALLVLRELVSNAIIHGHGMDTAKQVNCRLCVWDSGQLSVTVEDQGPGFDYNSVALQLPEDPRTIQKRGIILVNALCTGLEFHGRGNRVTGWMDTGNPSTLWPRPEPMETHSG
jgi:anti-sigma regulatory factor (Ser/Thr protein kinase)